MHDKNAWNKKINEKEGYKGLTGLREQKLAKESGENDKNLLWHFDQSKRERIVFEKFWKSDESEKTQSC